MGCYCAKTYGGRCKYHPMEVYTSPAIDRGLYEILVPTVRYNGKPFHLRYHRIWDEKVRAISGGLTIMEPVKGQWISPNNDLFKERMIPVRFIASREQVEKIIEMTLIYYEQDAIMAYKISDEVIMRYNDE